MFLTCPCVCAFWPKVNWVAGAVPKTETTEFVIAVTFFPAPLHTPGNGVGALRCVGGCAATEAGGGGRCCVVMYLYKAYFVSTHGESQTQRGKVRGGWGTLQFPIAMSDTVGRSVTDLLMDWEIVSPAGTLEEFCSLQPNIILCDCVLKVCSSKGIKQYGDALQMLSLTTTIKPGTNSPHIISTGGGCFLL